MNIDEILAKIHEAGFKVAMQKTMVLSQSQAEEFYKDHADKPYFHDLISEMTRLVAEFIFEMIVSVILFEII